MNRLGVPRDKALLTLVLVSKQVSNGYAAVALQH